MKNHQAFSRHLCRPAWFAGKSWKADSGPEFIYGAVTL
jgi:hypothetical protein